MSEASTIVGIVGGVVAIFTALFSVLYLRRQTLLMATQVDKQVEIKITRDLDAPEGVIDNKLRTFINRRVNDVRTQLRTDINAFSTRLEQVEHNLEHSHIDDVAKLWSDQRDAVDVARDSSSKVYDLERELRNLQQVVEDMQQGVGNQTMIRTQIRGIAEQLLRMTNQE